MVKKEKIEVKLDDDTVIESSEMADPETANVLIKNWKTQPHKSINNALIKAFSEKCDGVKLGEISEKPVYDVDKVFELMVEASIEKYDLTIEKSVATSRVGVKAQLTSLQAKIREMDPEMAKTLGI